MKRSLEITKISTEYELLALPLVSTFCENSFLTINCFMLPADCLYFCLSDVWCLDLFLFGIFVCFVCVKGNRVHAAYLKMCQIFLGHLVQILWGTNRRQP